MKTVGVVRFLGTNCDQDVWQAIEFAGHKPQWLWYKDHFDEKDVDAVVIPGGFSYGDYLRSGALAAKAPVMADVIKVANAGKPVMGICNGFQILCEVGLLPGALVRNNHLRFVDRWVELEPEHQSPCFASHVKKNITLPVAHGDGRYYADDDTLKKIHDKEQIWFRYNENPNGSISDIAGVMNENKNVAAMMPHPDRAVAKWMGGTDGLSFFNSLGSL